MNLVKEIVKMVKDIKNVDTLRVIYIFILNVKKNKK